MQKNQDLKKVARWAGPDPRIASFGVCFTSRASFRCVHRARTPLRRLVHTRWRMEGRINSCVYAVRTSLTTRYSRTRDCPFGRCEISRITVALAPRVWLLPGVFPFSYSCHAIEIPRFGGLHLHTTGTLRATFFRCIMRDLRLGSRGIVCSILSHPPFSKLQLLPKRSCKEYHLVVH